MKKEGYEFFNDTDEVYTFVSKGKQDILKIVIFQTINVNEYCLVLADFDFENGDISDISNSNNGDISKIMATVLKIIINFLERNKSAKILLQGNTEIKQKLYTRLINNYIVELSNFITVKGIEDGIPVPYSIGKDFKQFYICKK